MDEFIIREVIKALAKISQPKTTEPRQLNVADWASWKRKVHRILQDADEKQLDFTTRTYIAEEER